MKNLQTIKDEYSEEKGYHDWDYYLLRCPVTSVNSVDEIAKRYARECCKATLEKAAERCEEIHNSGSTWIDEDVINDEENIVLL